jgi:hypothetical protein
VLAMLAAPAAADPVTGDQPRGIVAAMTKEQMSPTASVSDAGTAMIQGQARGHPFLVAFNCQTPGNCPTVTFILRTQKPGYPAAKVNEWNSRKRFARMLSTKAGPTLAMDVNLTGGMSEELFRDHLQWWDEMVKEMDEFLAK